MVRDKASLQKAGIHVRKLKPKVTTTNNVGPENPSLGQLLLMSHSQGHVVSHINPATLDTAAINWSHSKPEYNLRGKLQFVWIAVLHCLKHENL